MVLIKAREKHLFTWLTLKTTVICYRERHTGRRDIHGKSWRTTELTYAVLSPRSGGAIILALERYRWEDCDSKGTLGSIASSGLT